jgi:hypothetical protein
VAADVFAQDEKFPGSVKERRRVESPRSSEDLLLAPETRREFAQQIRIDLEVRVRGTKAADANGLDRSLTADTTTGGGKEVALQVFRLEGSVAELNADHVVFGSTGWNEPADLADLTSRFDQALGPEESSGKFFIVTWRAHRHGERLSVDTYLKGFFPCKTIFDAADGSVRPLGYLS